MVGMMPKIEKALKLFEQLFSGEYDPFKFSIDMEDYLFDNYDEMLAEDKAVTEFLNNDVPDICAEGEPGFDSSAMIAALKPIYEKAKAMLL